MVDKKAISESVIRSCSKMIAEEILSHGYDDGIDLLAICIDIVDPDRKKEEENQAFCRRGY